MIDVLDELNQKMLGCTAPCWAKRAHDEILKLRAEIVRLRAELAAAKTEINRLEDVVDDWRVETKYAGEKNDI